METSSFSIKSPFLENVKLLMEAAGSRVSAYSLYI